ncbi:uncharacterized protein [Arachis hypogaea]|uniref:uncharacterized protein n=1 Tax=Arachis hypogaea TaxID=3818 RepID=UPI003B20BC09
MKPDYFMLSLFIPGPQSPGNDIDIYLQSLIEELKELWESGVETYDSKENKTFNMRACLLWTINDFPAYAMLSRWSTKEKLACPCCNDETSSIYLKHSHKTVYMDHRRFLPMNHPWRHNKRSFNRKTELRSPPQLLEGSAVFDILRESNMFRHNLDVMHIEKNIVDSIIGTLLDIPGKTKDHAAARFDLKDMGIRKNLQPKDTKDGKKTKLAKACFSMTPAEKTIFCSVLKAAKLPDGSASNIARCVHETEKKISGYKTHDAHFMLHYLLQVPIKSILPDHVAITLVRLCSFFHRICQKVISLDEVVNLEAEIAETLCQLERIFPPSFFNIMVHLPIHLANEVRLGGLVQYRWMYPVERFHTRHRDARRKTQNSGVTLEALTPSFASVKDKNPIEAKVAYYGRIVDMFELDYYGQFKVVLFKCEWYTAAKENFGLSYVYFNKKCYQEEPFVLASQVNQCFYVQDPYVSDKHYVMKTIPRDLFRVSDDLESDSPIIYAREPCEPEVIPCLPNDNGEIDLVRNDLRATIIDMDLNMFAKQYCEEDEESEYEYMEDLDSGTS